jgi:hypothetical protein
MKNSNQAEIYLGKAGKIFGPYSSVEIDQMSTTGKLATFFWIWNPEKEEWKPLETPPPSPVKTQAKTKQSSEWSSEAALCYDQLNTISGTLEEITETGCILTSNHQGAAPLFAEKSKVTINTLDSKKKTSKKTSARIIQIIRNQGHWNYRLRWL